MLVHDRENVARLQHAHADHIESLYRSLAAIPGNPHGVVMQKIGDVRTFIAAGHRLENRAIFSGQETAEQIDQVLGHFAEHHSNCVIEVNPANYYVDPPRNWEQRLLKQLLLRECFIDGFRCVWQISPEKSEVPAVPDYRIERFAVDRWDEFERLKGVVESSPPADGSLKPRPEDQWFGYIVFDAANVPCATGSLYAGKSGGYLSWWFTHPSHRARGLQQLGIRHRMADAVARGCPVIFTVSDFNFSSPANLQRCGFQLAYNYLLVRRDRAEGSQS